VNADARAIGAMVRANARYWPSVLPRVHRGLRHWQGAARDIPDEGLRRLALGKIADERFNTEVAATLATLAPRSHRDRVIDAIVPLQVMYDYLDGLSEEPSPDPINSSRNLFSAFTVSLTTGQPKPVDYYAGLPVRDDGGYLEALVTSCRRAFTLLPMAPIVAPVAIEAALRCGESQTRTHAIEALGTEQLADWATAASQGTGLTWWEYTAGGTASILCVHALIAAATDPRITVGAAKRLDRAYLYISAISTLLDSVIDRDTDLQDGSHSFIGYYEDDASTREGIAGVVARAVAEGRGIRHGGHHHMTAAGVAAYYLSAPAATRPPAAAIKARAVRDLGPLAVAALGIFRLWRLAKAARQR
jgi:tetraprenyl-beta-curcumene synthase